ncbi:MAG: hypothetical protein JJU40_12420 [Rhodobacteraceae bacterium]|nr:hypothetical protein [Paracoccaceae bacterium]
MPLEAPITPGTVDWTGENPGIILKDKDDAIAAAALFFRIAWSPVGQGTVLMLYGSPGAVEGPANAPNALISDNPALSEFLRTGFIQRLEGFAKLPAFAGLHHRDLTAARQTGDPAGSRFTETVCAEDLMVELVWEDLESPKALELDPELTGTGAHTMFSLLVPARQGRIFVNGSPLPGHVGKRVQAGMETTTAFLYFSETWVIPPSE